MTVDWNLFFPPGTRVLALPDWINPRIYLPALHPLRTWEHSAFYPASRLGARLYRLSIRLRAAAGLAEARTTRSSGWPLKEFVQVVLPSLASAVILVGTPSPSQQLTVQLRDEKGRVLGYLKYAETDIARKKLRQELFILSNLPDGVAPQPLKFGTLGDGEAFLKTVLPGKLLGVTLPPPAHLIDLLDSLVVHPPITSEAHPWVRGMRAREMPGFDALFQPLANRNWPVTIQHGDCAPWNLLEAPDGRLRAVDWECGTLEGFPYLDLAYYILQTSALIRRRAPLEAARYTVRYLQGHPAFALSSTEAQALTRLAAYDAYWKYLEDGASRNTGLQTWRRAIWEDVMWTV